MTLPPSLANRASTEEVRIGILSDTHLRQGDTLPGQVTQVFKGMDLILHAGDILYPGVLDQLEKAAPVLAAKGDDDRKLIDVRVEEEHFLSLGGLSLWLRHRMPFGVIHALRHGPQSELTELIVRESSCIPDIIVFGDTHAAMVKRSQGILFINPGSPTLPDYVSKLGTVALLTIASGEAEAHIVPLD
ncbi:MAG: YfcE family phosphodiesterase [Chloroflexi bacterium]|nr:YfcE family phosphodiesterase [Chloroflexota bacterium]